MTMQILRMIAVFVLFATGAMAEDGARLTVVGEGRVDAAPDMATITLGVTAQADTATAAMDETSAGVAALLERLAAAGLEARDVQTSGLSLNPVWDNQTYSSGAPRITGYVVSNTVTARVRALDSIGGVLDDVLEAGANMFNGLSFGLQDPQPALDAARTAAVADARRKAELFATAAGVTLGPIVSISEAQDGGGPQPMFRMDAAMASDGVPVVAGELTVAARVTVVWAIAE
jgi:uncharacterized protein YggE